MHRYFESAHAYHLLEDPDVVIRTDRRFICAIGSDAGRWRQLILAGRAMKL